MKGIVFSIKHRERHYRPQYHNRHITFASIKRFFSRYSIELLFSLVFLLAIVLGSFSFDRVSDDTLQKLDFLFLTNLDNRLELAPFDLFCSSFASGFVFIFASFLLSFTAWGMFALPLLCAFRGFGVGLSSAYMFSQYSVTGIGFYILIVLPATVLFLFAFIMSLKESFTQSVLLLKTYFSSTYDAFLLRRTKTYLFRNCVILILVAFSAVIDMVLWLLFAGMFNF